MNARTSIVNISGDFEESLVQFSRHLGISQLRRKLFLAIYGKGDKPKTKRELMRRAGIAEEGNNAQQAQNELDYLAKHHLIVKTRSDKRLDDGSRNLYSKDQTVRANKARIVAHADDPKKRESTVTKRSKLPANTTETTLTVVYRDVSYPPRELTIDDIDSFAAVRSTRGTSKQLVGMSEEKFKHGVQKIIGELGLFKDWGGEKSDLLSTRLKLDGRRRSSAFAFKGPGQSGILTPAKMGKNGDQALRLFEEPADIFVIQHWREIGSAVRSLVSSLAVAHSVMRRRRLIYCFIDGQDSMRIVESYPEAFL